MAGTLTQTYKPALALKQQILKATLAWRSDASGNVNGTLTDQLVGFVMRAVFIPSPSAPPSAGHTVTLLDENGIDVLSGQGANLSASAATGVVPGVPLKDGTTVSTTQRTIADQLELRVINAGNAKEGSVVLYILQG